MTTKMPIKPFRLLSAQEEKALALQIQMGDEEAKRILIENNMGLTIKVVRNSRLNPGQLEFFDRQHEAIKGLIHAAEIFDPSRDTRFSTCAMPWIKKSHNREVKKTHHSIRRPEYVYTLIGKLKKARQEYAKTHDGLPSDDDLAPIMDCTVEQVKNAKVQENYTEPLSFDAVLRQTLKNEEAGERVEYFLRSITPGPEEKLLEAEKQQVLMTMMIQAELMPNEILVLKCRFWDRNTLEETGQILKLTRERIRQIEKKALQKMRRYALKHPEMAELLQVCS